MSRGKRNPLTVPITGTLLCLSGLAGGASLIHVEPETYEFGLVTNTAPVAKVFTVHNKGNSDLDIIRVASGCSSCLTTTLDTTRIASGKSTSLRCELDTYLLDGPVSRTVLIYSNDPSNEVLKVTMEGIVARAYEVRPAEVKIEGLPDQRDAAVEIAPLLALGGGLCAASSDTPDIKADVFPLDHGRYLLVVHALDSLPRGLTLFNVFVRSSDTNDPLCRIRGSVYNPPDYEVIPATLVFNATDELQQRTLWLRQHGGTPITLLDAIPSSDKIHCEIEPLRSSRDYRIYVSAIQQSQSTGQVQRVTLKTANGDGSEVLIGVPISVRQSQ